MKFRFQGQIGHSVRYCRCAENQNSAVAPKAGKSSAFRVSEGFRLAALFKASAFGPIYGLWGNVRLLLPNRIHHWIYSRPQNLPCPACRQHNQIWPKRYSEWHPQGGEETLELPRSSPLFVSNWTFCAGGGGLGRIPCWNQPEKSRKCQAGRSSI